MKKKALILASVALTFCIAAAGQQSGGAPAAPTPPSQPTQPTQPNNRNAPGTGVQGQEQLPPGVPVQPQQPNRFGTQPGVVAATNRTMLFTNRFAQTNFGNLTNRFGTTPGLNTNVLSPTGSATNRLFATNTFATNAFGTNVIMRDQAFSQTDRMLLAQIRQTVQTQMRVIGGTPVTASAWSPVHYIVRDSTVTVVGFVTTTEERQRLLNTVQGVPGVAQVIDQLQLRALDQGFSDGDRQLLAQVRQTLEPVINSSAATPTPVRFLARDGVVTIVGVVPTAEQSQQIVELIRQVPGVVNVNSRVTINPNFQSGAITPTPTGAVTPGTAGSADQPGSTSITSAVNSRILSPTGRPVGPTTSPITPAVTPTGRPTNAVPPGTP